MNTSMRMASVILLAAFTSATAFAADTPASLEGAVVVDAKKAKELSEDKSTKVYDVRKKLEFAEERIPGAVFLPYEEKSEKKEGYDESKDKFDTAQLPADKAAPVMMYCNGPECWKSFKASRAAIKAGHKKVYWMRGGIPEWKKAGYPTAK